jgi:hypothetical protein
MLLAKEEKLSSAQLDSGIRPRFSPSANHKHLNVTHKACRCLRYRLTRRFQPHLPKAALHQRTIYNLHHFFDARVAIRQRPVMLV